MLVNLPPQGSKASKKGGITFHSWGVSSKKGNFTFFENMPAPHLRKTDYEVFYFYPGWAEEQKWPASLPPPSWSVSLLPIAFLPAPALFPLLLAVASPLSSPSLSAGPALAATLLSPSRWSDPNPVRLRNRMDAIACYTLYPLPLFPHNLFTHLKK